MTKSSRVSSTNKKAFDSLLIIESDSLQRKGIAVAMLDHFSDLEMTAEAFDAIKLAAKKNFQVIISEYCSGKTENLETLRILRKFNPQASLIILNNEAENDENKILSDLNVYRYFDKPVSLSKLLNAVESITRDSKNHYPKKDKH